MHDWHCILHCKWSKSDRFSFSWSQLLKNIPFVTYSNGWAPPRPRSRRRSMTDSSRWKNWNKQWTLSRFVTPPFIKTDKSWPSPWRFEHKVKSTTSAVIWHIPLRGCDDSSSQGSSSGTSVTHCWLIVCPLFRTQPSERCRNARRRSATWFAPSRGRSRSWPSWSPPTRRRRSKMPMDTWSVWATKSPTWRGGTRKSRSCRAPRTTSTSSRWVTTAQRISEPGAMACLQKVQSCKLWL